MKKTDMLEFISSPTLARIGKGESINSEIISRICAALDCQPGDIMEYVQDTRQGESGPLPIVATAESEG
jgi:DNA-binding Xre family transcriptional regulator